MARKKGDFIFAANFEVNGQAPLDARLVVNNKSELTDLNTWSKDGNSYYIYKGMIVAVTSEKKVYMYVADTVSAENIKLSSSWKDITSDINYNNFINKPSINGVTLEGNKTSKELKIASLDDIKDMETKTYAKSTYATIASVNSKNQQQDTKIQSLESKNTEQDSSISDLKAKDSSLQEQVDALVSRSDVVDVVANKAALDSYDKSSVTENDVIKVLKDESRDNAITYYRLVSNDWKFIGSIGEVYTKEEVNTITNKLDKKVIVTDNHTSQDNDNKLIVDLEDTTFDKIICPEAPDEQTYVRKKGGWVSSHDKAFIDNKLADITANFSRTNSKLDNAIEQNNTKNTEQDEAINQANIAIAKNTEIVGDKPYEVGNGMARVNLPKGTPITDYRTTTILTVNSGNSSNGTIEITIGKHSFTYACTDDIRYSKFDLANLLKEAANEKSYFNAIVEGNKIIIISNNLGSFSSRININTTKADISISSSQSLSKETIYLLDKSLIENKPNTIFVIQYNFSLNGESFNIDKNCTLSFEGGSINNGTINGNNTKINEISPYNILHDTKIKNFNIPYIDIRWIGGKSDDENFDNAIIIQKAISNICKYSGGISIKIVGRYYWKSSIETKEDVNIIGEHYNSRKLISGEDSRLNTSPSEIIVDNNIVALTMIGKGTSSKKASNFSFRNLKIREKNQGKTQTSIFLDYKASGAPSRVESIIDCEITGFKKFFNNEVQSYAKSGTTIGNFQINRCNVYGNYNFMYVKGSDTTPTITNLAIENSNIEHNFESLVLYNLFGDNVIRNCLFEGESTPIKCVINRGSILIESCYFESITKPDEEKDGYLIEVKGFGKFSHFSFRNCYTRDALGVKLRNLDIQELTGIDIYSHKNDLTGSIFKDIIYEINSENFDDLSGIMFEKPHFSYYSGINTNNVQSFYGKESFQNMLGTKVPEGVLTSIANENFSITAGDTIIVGLYKEQLQNNGNVTIYIINAQGQTIASPSYNAGGLIYFKLKVKDSTSRILVKVKIVGGDTTFFSNIIIVKANTKTRLMDYGLFYNPSRLLFSSNYTNPNSIGSFIGKICYDSASNEKTPMYSDGRVWKKLNGDLYKALKRGRTNERPVTEELSVNESNMLYYNTETSSFDIWDGVKWMNMEVNPVSSKHKGTTDERPKNVVDGFIFKNTQTNNIEMFIDNDWIIIHSNK